MKKDRHVLMEKMYPWFARYSENIIQDAPSQKDMYIQALSQWTRLTGLTRQDLMKWHLKTQPFHSPLVQDLIEGWNRNGEDDDLPLNHEVESVKTKSTDKTGTTKDSTKSKENTPSKQGVEKSGRTDGSFVYDNPVRDTALRQGDFGFTTSSGLSMKISLLSGNVLRKIVIIISSIIVVSSRYYHRLKYRVTQCLQTE